ncbi:hypothetical protein [Rhodosalinus sp.]|uniref:hypothetical protein n=1 Tax=Rhodosalinus sp. TaxID=2047741 RepID=UPI00356AC165
MQAAAVGLGPLPGLALEAALAILRHDARVTEAPAPWLRVTHPGESSVEIGMRLWCRAEDYADLKFDMLKRAKAAFDAEGVTIPYPHRVELRKSG